MAEKETGFTTMAGPKGTGVCPRDWHRHAGLRLHGQSPHQRVQNPPLHDVPAPGHPPA